MWECAAESQSMAVAESWHCPTCLSRRRPMETLSPQAYNLLSILISSEEEFEMIPPVQVCWECAGRLLNTLKFQERALRAMTLLFTCDIKAETNSVSFLSKSTKSGFDYEFEEDSDEDEHLKSLIGAEAKEPLFPLKPKSQTVNIEIIKNEKDVIVATASEPSKGKIKYVDSRVKKLYVTKEDVLKIRDRDRKREEYMKSPYKCKTCIKPFKLKHLLDRHNKMKHNKKAPYKCDICSQRFGSAPTFSGHRLRHRALFACTACDFASRSGAGRVKRHYGDAHAPLKTSLRLRYRQLEKDRERVQCDKCHKVMMKHKLSRHIILIHGGVAKCQCELCGVTLLDKPSLLAHMRRTHEPDEQGAYCVECDEHFKNKNNFSVHLETCPKHNSPDKFKYHCDMCDQKFASEVNLMNHQRSDHEEVSCYICNKRLKKHSMRNHVRFVHAGVKLPRRHVCDVCGERFQAKNTLERHKVRHTGERPHVCDVCGATFTQKSSLATHVRLIHLKLGRKTLRPPK